MNSGMASAPIATPSSPQSSETPAVPDTTAASSRMVKAPLRGLSALSETFRTFLPSWVVLTLSRTMPQRFLNESAVVLLSAYIGAVWMLFSVYVCTAGSVGVPSLYKVAGK